MYRKLTSNWGTRILTSNILLAWRMHNFLLLRKVMGPAGPWCSSSPQPVRGSSPVKGSSLVVFLLEIWPQNWAPNISETGVNGINTIVFLRNQTELVIISELVLAPEWTSDLLKNRVYQKIWPQSESQDFCTLKFPENPDNFEVRVAAMARLLVC